ncbi:Na+ dependent nucleoside transporter domain-containing protein [Clostridium haemolyticum]|uniref:NupC/NupG family nucleoside CNT transporter n=1 Tax=Clostridium haemolyticum TaxID=84025 RepID=UPI0009D5B6AC|nr:NupC/NupG family nucleoside CNT transporter [Clostridium haemolyticum]OOB76766.1 Na+ dependent nucleoside transporter domain-containing protein [Clostridium haemolyticum]
MSRFIGLLGIAVILLIAYLLSNDKKKINWKLVAIGIGLQVVFALIVLKVPLGRMIFEKIGGGINLLLGFTKKGSSFIFGDLANNNKFGIIFAFQILPTIVFFSSFMSILYHLGIMQFIISILAKGIAKLLGTSGAETLSAVGNIFLGQTEAPLLIKPFIKNMTKSEIMTIMVGGMATVAGGVMAGYVAMGINASYLLAASIMAAPGGLIISKILCPQTEEAPTSGDVNIDIEVQSSNVVDAASTGASEGLSLALNVGAMLLAFIALVAFVNSLIGWVGGFFGAGYLSLGWILGRLFSPLAFLMGIPANDIVTAGNLFGTKVVLNEFVAYAQFAKLQATLNPKTVMILTYALCGFANISSIGIQIGGIGGLAPEKRKDIAKMGVKAMIGGLLTTCLTGTIAGIIS